MIRWLSFLVSPKPVCVHEGPSIFRNEWTVPFWQCPDRTLVLAAARQRTGAPQNALARSRHTARRCANRRLGAYKAPVGPWFGHFTPRHGRRRVGVCSAPHVRHAVSLCNPSTNTHPSGWMAAWTASRRLAGAHGFIDNGDSWTSPTEHGAHIGRALVRSWDMSLVNPSHPAPENSILPRTTSLMNAIECRGYEPDLRRTRSRRSEDDGAERAGSDLKSPA